MGQVFTSPDLLGELLKHEYSRETCREVVTLAASATGYRMGSVLGKVTATGAYAMSPATGEDGSETACAVLLSDIAPSTEAITGTVVLARGPAIVADIKLVYDASVTTDALKKEKQDQLAALGIATREEV